jgi:hypothetical protein
VGGKKSKTGIGANFSGRFLTMGVGYGMGVERDGAVGAGPFTNGFQSGTDLSLFGKPSAAQAAPFQDPIDAVSSNPYSLSSAAMRAAFGVEALVGYTQALDGTAGDEMLGDNLRRVRWLDVTVPDRFGIDHDHGAVLTLVEAAGFVDAHATAQAGGFGPPLEFGVQIAGSIGGAGGTRCALGARVVADKDVVLKGGHRVFLL